jgi:hypothetical protein
MNSPSIVHRIKTFLGKFKSIPERQWATTWRRVDQNGHETFCALGHLGVLSADKMTPEGEELCQLLHPVARQWADGYSSQVPCSGSVTIINDHSIRGVPDHPRERITWALRKRLAMELGHDPSEPEEEIQSVANL